ncbi:cuticle protein 10.9-like [Galendromus occidentalis]|uniref:Cuticle protein 10.9-like n=1 Tax=Galendromus occidentalis TaxID=34638 RepID=A0AAJ6VYQ8_9ACAR|nr:cuticle protein 10.9-like [Galendromus occidentalis]
MKFVLPLLFVGVAYAQQYGGYGVQTLQSVPLPPPGYVSPSLLREKLEPPKPFAFKYEGPDAYGGYSSHAAQGDAYGRVSGQYTVQNPDGTSRLVKYVADPEYGFNTEVDTNEEGTKTSAPASALIKSSAPEGGYYPQVKKAVYAAPAYAAPVYAAPIAHRGYRS